MTKSGNGSRLLGIGVVLLIMTIALFVMALTLNDMSQRGMGFVVMSILGEGAILAMLMFGPMGRAIARLLEPENHDDARIADLEDRLALMEQRGLTSGEVEQQYARLSEIEERIEFTERMLTRGGEQPPRELH